MNWRVTKEDKELTKLVGQRIASIDIDRVDGTVTAIVISTPDHAIRIAMDSYTMKISVPKTSYQIIGELTLGTIITQLTPETFTELADAKKRLEQIQSEYPLSFTGEIIEGR